MPPLFSITPKEKHLSFTILRMLFREQPASAHPMILTRQ